MDAIPISHQSPFPQLGLQQQPHHLSHQRPQEPMLFPHTQHGQRSAIDPEALAAAVQQYLPQQQNAQLHPHPHPHAIPRHFAQHPHASSHAFMQMNGQRPSSYISLPPGVDPSTVDFRTFYPYNPSEVKHRKRTTRPQLKVLEETFKRETKPNAALRKKLAAELEMTPRGVQVWFQNRRAKEKTLAKKAAAQGKKVLNLQAKGNVTDSPEGVDELCADGAEDADEDPLDADEFETEDINGGANITGNHQTGHENTRTSLSSLFPSNPSVPPPRQSDGFSTDSLVYAGESSNEARSQASHSKSTSPQSTPPEMTPPNDALDINVNVEGLAVPDGGPVAFVTDSTDGKHQMQIFDYSDSQSHWNANGSSVPRAASRTPTLGYDPMSTSNQSGDDQLGNPSQDTFLRRPSLPTHLGANTFARVQPNMASRPNARGAYRPPPYSTSGGARVGSSFCGSDLNGTRTSLERLAVHPYAYAAMQQNSTVYGPGAVANMGSMSGMGVGRFRPTLPATTQSTPNGTPQARPTDLPVSHSALPSIPGHAGNEAMDISSAGSENRQHTDLKLPTPLQSAHTQAYQQESGNCAYPKFDEAGRVVDQLGAHSVVVSPRTYEPPSAGPLPAEDYSFGAVGGENGEGEQNGVSAQVEIPPTAAPMEGAGPSRTSMDSMSSFGSGMHVQQSMVKPEMPDSNMVDVLDPTSHPLTHHHLGSTVSFSSLDDGTNNANGNMYYRDNASSGFGPYSSYPARFGSIVSIAETESSIASGACFSSEAGSMMQPDQMSVSNGIARPNSTYMEARRPSYTGQMMDMFSHLDVQNGSNASLPQSIESHSSHMQHQNAMAAQSSLSVQYNRPSSEMGNPLPTVDERSPGVQSTRSSFSSPTSQFSSQYSGMSFAHTNAPSLGHSATSSRSSLSLSIPPSLSPVSHTHSANSAAHPYHRPSRNFHKAHQNRSRLRLDNTDKLDFLRADYDDVSGTGHYSPINGPQKDIFGDSVRESEGGLQFAPCVPDDMPPMASSSSLNVHNGGQDMEMTSTNASSQGQTPYFGGYNASKYSVNSYDSVPCSSSFHY